MEKKLMLTLTLLITVMITVTVTGCSMPRTSEEVLSLEMSDFKVAAGRTIDDPKKALEFEQRVGDLEQLLFRFSEQGQAFQEDLQRLNANYDAKDSEFSALFDRYSRERVRLRDQILAVHLQMIALTTSKEWRSLVKYERKAIAAGQYKGG